jgi:hypothetical protein
MSAITNRAMRASSVTVLIVVPLLGFSKSKLVLLAEFDPL